MKLLKVLPVFREMEVDDEDYSKCDQFTWRTTLSSTGGYWVYTNINGKKVSVAQIIFNTKDKYDHKDRNPFNNKRNNLRICTVSQNTANTGKLDFALREPTSKYKGVYRSKAKRAQNNPWMARIQTKGNSKYLGCFKTEILAAQAYNAAAQKRFGEFAYINKIQNKEE